MYPFEVWNEEQQRIDFHFDRFSAFREELFRQYPPTHEHHRVEIHLIFPSDRLRDVWVHDWNPHHEMGNDLSVYDCFYHSDRWSTVFDVYPAHGSRPHEDSWICFAEENHADPWGEPIQLMSTSDCIYNDTSHRYAYFRGKYWKVLSFMPFGMAGPSPPVDLWNILRGLPTFHGIHVPIYENVGPLVWNLEGQLQLYTHPYDRSISVNWMKEGF